MISPARVKGRPRHGSSWLLAGLLLVAIVWLPAWVAGSITASSQSTPFAAEPWQAWRFLGTMLVASPSAEAPSPGKALQKAETSIASATINVDSVELLYVPAGQTVSFDTVTASGKRRVTVDPQSSLVWKVRGGADYSNATGVVGLLDFRTGDPVWTTET